MENFLSVHSWSGVASGYFGVGASKLIVTSKSSKGQRWLDSGAGWLLSWLSVAFFSALFSARPFCSMQEG